MNIIEFNPKPIGALISAGRLAVPIHQREYFWEEDQICALFEDFERHMEGGQDYYLGALVLTESDDDGYNVVDGQQRLATTMIMLAVIRDIFERVGESTSVESIETDYLFRIDLRSKTTVSKLALNVRDQEFFLTRILKNPKERKAGIPSGGRSNERLEKAQAIIRQRFEDIARPLSKELLESRFNAWIDFIRRRAKVLVLTVKDDEHAYTVFETMNDRGLRVSEADLVKNHLYGLAEKANRSARERSRLPEVISKWQAMNDLVEFIGPREDVVDYLRIFCTVFYGMTRRKDLFRVVRDRVKTQTSAVQFVFQLEEYARDYVAMLTPSHSKWNDYPPSVKKSLKTLSELDVMQIRYLMLAVAHHFNAKEAASSFNLFVNWIVRFNVAGQSKIGRLDMEYANTANEIHAGGIKTARDLEVRMSKHLADDDTFKSLFAGMKVSQAKLARYYLESMERMQLGNEEAELVPDDNTLRVNLEHIMPLNFSAKWKNITPEDGERLYNRLGNLVLLNARKNSKIGDAPFEDKKKVFAGSAFRLTKSVAKYQSWGEYEINDRQSAMAEMAVKTWPLKAD